MYGGTDVLGPKFRAHTAYLTVTVQQVTCFRVQQQTRLSITFIVNEHPNGKNHTKHNVIYFLRAHATVTKHQINLPD